MASAYEIPNLRFSLPAGGAVARRRFVSVNASELGVTANATSTVVGASANETATGEVLEVYDGIVIVEASAAVNAGAKVSSTADGRAVTTTTGDVVGIAMTTAKAAGEFVSVKI
ncbi:hypothetical protein D3C75_232890 [compost metagenome]